LFVKKYLHHTVGWSICHYAQAGHKIPDNADEILNDAFLCITYTMKNNNVPSQLLLNSDQGQLQLAQGSSITYALTGPK
jgi:hypothetical protein